MDQSRLFSLVEMVAVYAIALSWAGWELWKVRKRPAKPSDNEASAAPSEEAKPGHSERQQNLDP